MSAEFTPFDDPSDYPTIVGHADSLTHETIYADHAIVNQWPRRQEEDLAFAVAAIESGFLSRKQLAGLVSDWTIHGDLSLSDHLIAKSAVTVEDSHPIKDLAQRKLHQFQTKVLAVQGSSSHFSRSELLVKHLDHNGRIAPCLGLNYQSIIDMKSRSRGTMTEFRLLKKLGQGGLGIVWLACDERLKRLVAIKEIARDADDQSLESRRFRREAEITGRLEHPSIVPLHQFGIDARSDKQFYVMRYIGRKTLEDAIDIFHERRRAGEKDHLQLRYLLNSFVSICHAIAYAHSRNVIHRDLKPENIVLDSYGQVIVLDWGLAKLTGELELMESSEQSAGDPGGELAQTMDGQVLGTPMYMAPEQATGRLDEIDERTDVYGLGAILFSILTGCAPHESSRERLSTNATMSELLRVIVSCPPPPARKLNPVAPPELEAICAKALSIKPYNRYQSASALASDVQLWLAGESVSAYHDPWKKRAVRWIANHTLISQCCAALSTILIVSVVTFAVTTHHAALAERQTRFENMKFQSRLLKTEIDTRAEEMVKNIRFMSSLPPIPALLGIRETEADNPDSNEPLLIERLQDIYSGLLDANPQYLSVSFLAVDPTEDGRELRQVARVERRKSGGPLSRSLSGATPAVYEETPPLKTMLGLKPGEVHMEEAVLVPRDTELPTPPNVVLGGTPVLRKSDGKLIGLVVIETDVEYRLRILLKGFLQQDRHAHVINSDLKFMLSLDQNGEFQNAMRGHAVTGLPPEVMEYLTDKSAPASFDDGKNFVARKVMLNDTPDSPWLCFVLIAE